MARRMIGHTFRARRAGDRWWGPSGVDNLSPGGAAGYFHRRHVRGRAPSRTAGKLKRFASSSQRPGPAPTLAEHARQWLEAHRPWLAATTAYDRRRIIEAHHLPAPPAHLGR